MVNKRHDHTFRNAVSGTRRFPPAGPSREHNASAPEYRRGRDRFHPPPVRTTFRPSRWRNWSSRSGRHRDQNRRCRHPNDLLGITRIAHPHTFHRTPVGDHQQIPVARDVLGKIVRVVRPINSGVWSKASFTSNRPRRLATVSPFSPLEFRVAVSILGKRAGTNECQGFTFSRTVFSAAVGS